MSWSRAVERWRPYIQRFTPEFPEDFVLAWIKRESGGGGSRAGWFTSLDERGVLQMHPGEARAIGLAPHEWASLSLGPWDVGFDFAEHYAISSRLLRYRKATADQALAQNGVTWTGAGYWSAVKLAHGLPAILSKGLPAFRAYTGRTPITWSEWVAWIKSAGWAPGGRSPSRVREILASASFVGGFGTGAGYSALAVAMFSGAAWLGWKLAKRSRK